MRIAHLTLLHGYNYGGILQTYATQKILTSYGHEVITLDYHPSRRMILVRKLTFNISALHERIRLWLDLRQFSGVVQFNNFRSKYFRFSLPCHNQRQLSKVCQDVDAVVVGSDQVWSPNWVRPPYFLDFPLASRCKRLALAVCCGQSSDNDEYLAYCSKTLSKFNAISVRNDFTADLVRKTTERIANLVCDPTLAIDLPSEPVPNITGPYILIYVINRKYSMPLASEVIQYLRSTLNLSVYSITPAELRGTESLDVDRVIHDISPFQWNYLIANANYVVTDSFHATVFAVKNHRNLAVLDSGFKSSGRFRTFLNNLGLKHLLISNLEKLSQRGNTFPACNWMDIDTKLAKMSETYHQFVKSAINK